MKKIAFLISSLVLISSVFTQGLPADYPFATHLDQFNNLFVTGETDDHELFFAKIAGQVIEITTYVNSGVTGKGMDLVTTPSGTYLYIVGYVHTQSENDKLIVLKYDLNGGALVDEVEYNFASDIDRGVGIALDDNENIYVCGYVTNSDKTTDYLVIKYNSSLQLAWHIEFDVNGGNEVATDILVDNDYVYVMGYKDEQQNGIGGPSNSKDIMLFACTKEGLDPGKAVIEIPGSSQIPTSFVITEMAPANSNVKSKLAVIGIGDTIINNIHQEDYFIGHFKVNTEGDMNVVDWYHRWGHRELDDAATDIVRNDDGDIVITGYFNDGSYDYDFTTLKYDTEEGTMMWDGVPEIFEHEGIDKASSISRKNNLYSVSGYTQNNPSTNYSTYTFEDNGSTAVQNWDSYIVPSFLLGYNIPNYTNFGAKNYVLDNGSVVVLTFAWNSQVSNFEVVKYNNNGVIEYTVTDDSDNRIANIGNVNEDKTFELKQNYPNPFNPVTVIRYSLPVQSYVTIKVYDMLGREVAELINGNVNAGSHSARFDGSKLASGIYIYKMTAINNNSRFEKTEKMTLIK